MHYETKSILDKIKGSIILATEEGEQEYVNIDAIPENLLDAEMIVSAIEARQGYRKSVIWRCVCPVCWQ